MVKFCASSNTKNHEADTASMKRILILGVNGFIGHHLSKRILAATDWEVYGMDMQTDRIADLLDEPRFHFFEGDITINKEWIEYHIRKCDTVMPLVAIATPATYVKEPLKVFELDFEANLPIVRGCVRHGKRLLFPSTSEVYGMSPDREFDPETSPLVYGPIAKQRWIYACSKQLVDRGRQKRAFTYIDDGIDALMAIIANKNSIASRKIYNIGNPKNNLSVREVAESMVKLALDYPEYRAAARKVRIVKTTAERYYGRGYQDVQNRVPKIDNTMRELHWRPRVGMREALKRIYDAYRTDVAEARHLVK